VQLQENLFQSRKDGTHQNVTTVVTLAEIWGTASERELSQALRYKYDVLKDKLLRDALIQQVGVTEWAALSENDRFTRLTQMKLKVQVLQEEGSAHVFVSYRLSSYDILVNCVLQSSSYQVINVTLIASVLWPHLF